MRTEPEIRKFEIALDINFAALPRADLEAMAEAGQEVVEVHRVLAKTGDNVVGELLKGHETFYEWDHYPPGDVYDRESHGQFYYHAHSAEQRFVNEHGHFHTFLRPRGMPPGIKPAPVPGFVMPDDPDDALSHLIAIAMTKQGFAFRLFTVNRWVTGEVWYRAADVITLLDYFKIDHAQPSWPVNRWITAMVRLFRPQIVALLEARDHAVASWAEQHPDRDVFEDRELEVTSYIDISVEDQVRSVARALMAHG
ncbi:MAG: hypothetical protein D6826_04960 [Alphaproteobacteria bacterium]|nr:MAG: hypothetical protein D6826_04960 [Alphaproteobacteria bacterium]